MLMENSCFDKQEWTSLPDEKIDGLSGRNRRMVTRVKDFSSMMF